jgi:hypothetical protein
MDGSGAVSPFWVIDSQGTAAAGCSRFRSRQPLKTDALVVSSVPKWIRCSVDSRGRRNSLPPMCMGEYSSELLAWHIPVSRAGKEEVTQPVCARLRMAQLRIKGIRITEDWASRLVFAPMKLNWAAPSSKMSLR